MGRPALSVRASLTSHVHRAAPHATTIAGTVNLIEGGKLTLVSHLLGLFHLLFREAAAHEHAIEFSPVLDVILDLRNRNLGLVSRVLGSFTEHVHYRLHYSPAVLVVLDARAQLLDKVAVGECDLLSDGTALSLDHGDAVEHLGLAAGVAHHHQGLLCLLGDEVVRVSRLLHQHGHHEIDVRIQIFLVQLRVNDLQGQASILGDLRPGRINLLHNCLDGLLRQRARSHHEELLVELRHPLDRVLRLYVLLPVRRLEVLHSLPELGLRVLERLLRGVIVRGGLRHVRANAGRAEHAIGLLLGLLVSRIPALLRRLEVVPRHARVTELHVCAHRLRPLLHHLLLD